MCQTTSIADVSNNQNIEHRFKQALPCSDILFVTLASLVEQIQVMKVNILCLAALAVATESFAPSQPTVSSRAETKLHFGIPTFQPKKDSDEKDDKEENIGLKGLAQLITAGMGAPFLGDYEGVDKETGKMMFSLEANNLVDKDGKSKQTSMPYFESGWVDPEDLEKEKRRREEGFKFPWQK
eukprot:scaffold1697_cov120-Cylindrotheca_fusiformis.AAC.52